jgi:hypothetical protein
LPGAAARTRQDNRFESTVSGARQVDQKISIGPILTIPYPLIIIPSRDHSHPFRLNNAKVTPIEAIIRAIENKKSP